MNQISEVRDRLARLGYTDAPDSTGDPTLDIIELAQWGTEKFADAHSAYQGPQKAWDRAVTARNQLPRHPIPAKLEAAEARVSEARGPRDAAFRELLRARAAEEYTRGLRFLLSSTDSGRTERWIKSVDSWVWAYFEA